MPAPAPRAPSRAASVASTALSLACGAFVLLAPVRARADDAQVYEIGKNRFDAGQYEEAAKRFIAMLDEAAPPCSKAKPSSTETCRLTDPDLIERGRALLAASLIALGRVKEADAVIEAVLRTNPSYSPSPASFPPDVLDRFSAVRARLRTELENLARERAEKARQKRLDAQRAAEAESARVAELERLASEERIVEPRSRWIALVPFGVGQYQNNKPALGTFFLVSEALAGGTSIMLGMLHASLALTPVTQTPDPADPTQLQKPDIDALRTRLEQLEFANRIAFGTWAALTLAGVIEAQVSFVPTRTIVRKRPLPQTLRPVPQIGLLPGGAIIGATGRF